ncbi:alpha/beta hydrolase [Roseospira goensis]|uniref:Alpha-beta hydrolase superfamily lysophospholipase n=1 Tax=Roseospira goensis TaxID=391922 RepID=A0A7W6WJX4_9PROT|nr:alpha/beta hydrolase [Roseospira goensis]MBB4285510.1 alpha-beta hydrolase superfamily lysophospholipase [Roseospira goensis]
MTGAGAEPPDDHGSGWGRRSALRLGLLAAGAPVLAACAPRLAPPGPGTAAAAPRLGSDGTVFVAGDGARLPLTRWERSDDPAAVVIALHGFNDYANAFREAGPFLANRGFAVWAPDQRGFGRAPHRGLWAGTARLVADLRELVAVARAAWPGRRVVVLGESMGGAVTMVALTDPDRPLAVDATVLSAPAVWGRAAMPWLYRMVLDVTSALAPGLRVTGKGLDIWPSDNIEMLRRLGRDPLMIRATRTDTIRGLVALMDAALRAAPRVPPPVLCLMGANDHIIPARPTLKALSAMVGDGDDPRRRAALYPDGWHMLLRDLGAVTPLEDIVAWIEDPAAPLPSGADRRARALLAGRLEVAPRSRPTVPAY